MMRRWAGVAVVGALCAGALAGCGSGDRAGAAAGPGASCAITSCTVTFRRGVSDGTVSILGVRAQLVSVENSLVTLRIGDQTISLPQDGAQVNSDGLKLSATSVTNDRVVVKISRS